MRRRFRFLCAVVLLAGLLLSSCAKKVSPTPAPAPTPVVPETAAPAPTPVVPETAAPAPEASSTPIPEVVEAPAPETPSEESVSALDDIRRSMDDGRYYEAFREMVAFEEAAQNDAEHAACEELFAELDRRLKEIEPETGAELERGFTVQGGGVLEVYAFNGPALVTVTDAAADTQPELASNYVTFYVRQGERGATHLPAGTYRVRYQVGYRWFGAEYGFGEYCTDGELAEPLYFDFYMDGQWTSNAKFSITL